MDWFSAMFAFEGWPMWPLAMEAGSNWGERRRFRSRSSRLILSTLLRHSEPPTDLYPGLLCERFSSSPNRFSDIWGWAFLQGSWLTQFSCNREAWSRKWRKKELIAWRINENLFLKFEESIMWGSLSLGVLLHMVGSSVSIQCYDCNKKDRFREMVRASPCNCICLLV